MREFKLVVNCETGAVRFVSTDADNREFRFQHTMEPAVALSFAEQMASTLAALSELAAAQQEGSQAH